ncbi:alpha/beta hydrolase [Planctomycetaceae bacterium SH139]
MVGSSDSTGLDSNTSNPSRVRAGQVDAGEAVTGGGVSRRRWLWRVLVAVACLLSVWQGLGFAIAYDYMTRNHHDLSPLETPADRGLQSLDVMIPVPTFDQEAGLAEAEQSLELAGWLLPADPQGERFQQGAIVLMLHGFGSSRSKVWLDESTNYRGSMFDQGAESLVKAGFHVLLVDFRNHGDSGDRGRVTLGLREANDVRAALTFIRDQLTTGELKIDPSRIGIRAESMGGAAALIAAAGPEGSLISALWTDSAFARADQAVADFLSHFGVPGILLPPVRFWLQQLCGESFADVQPVTLLEHVKCPTLLVHSADDTMIRVEHFQQYVRAAEQHAHIETWGLEGAQHARLWRLPGYIDRQTEFFLQHLGSK